MKDIRTEIIKKLIEKSAPNQKAFAESIQIPYTTLRSMLERGIGNASVDNVIKVCKGLGITTSDLEEMAGSIKYESDLHNVEAIKTSVQTELNAKDERDIQKELQKMIEGLNSNNGYAAFDGQTLDDLDEEDKELLIASLENSLRLAKKLAKQKFTPKKYRK